MVTADSRQLLHDLNKHLHNSPLTVIGWDSEFRVAFWSGQAREMFGWDEEDVLGKHPGDWNFVHEDDADSVQRIMAELASGHRTSNISANRNYTRDGRVTHCEWYNSALHSDDSQAILILSLVQDVTQQKLVDKQFQQMQKMEAIGQLTGGVAHDFNNLLTIIIGNSELLRAKLADQPELLELVDTVISGASKGAALTQQLLAFARQQPLSPRPTDVNALLTTMNNLLARTLGEDVEIVMDLLDGAATANVDPAQLESALLNLCINSRDAMPNGGQLTIESSFVYLDQSYVDDHAEVNPGEYVMVAVSDGGSGIEAENLTHIFEPFFSTKDRDKGSGLGLSMVFGFIKQSRGHMKVFSEVGEGTTVCLYLPRAEENDAATAPGSVEAEARGGRETILVVEDDDLVRRLACAQLSALGYRVIAAADGSEALTIVQERSDIDLLFTDVVMPRGRDGLQLSREALKTRPGLKVLFTSGYTQNAIVHQGTLDPNVKLLTKPYRRDTLARMIREALGG